LRQIFAYFSLASDKRRKREGLLDSSVIVCHADKLLGRREEAETMNDQTLRECGNHGGGLVRRSLAAGLMIAVLVTSSFAAPGEIDLTFGQGGRVFTTIAVPGFDYFYPMTEAMVVQPDGKILVCGRFWEDGVSYWYGTFILRYMPDGTLDLSFGNNGKVAVIGPDYPYGGQAIGADMTLLPDGRIVIIGQQTIAEGILVQRYTASGILDTSFGNNGTSVIPRTVFSAGTSITIQPDGKIVGAGWEYDRWWDPQNYYDAIVIFRLNPDGSPDATFGTAGTGVVKIVDGYDGPNVIAQPDGKILVAGVLWNPAHGIPSTPIIARFNSDGTPDINFGSGGRVIPSGNSFGGVVLQADAKIVVGGTIRYNPDGTLDGSFQGAGLFGSIFLTSDGKFVGAGQVSNGFGVRRLNSDGSLDQGFGTGGTSELPMNAGGTNYAYASAAAIQPDGNIVVGGFFGNYYSDSHEKVALLRVKGGNAAAAFFSLSGRVTTSDGRGISRARLTLVDGASGTRYAQTNPFGYYRFTDVSGGQNYNVSISSKRHRFAEPSRVIFVNANVTDVNFIANP
jgi:uncharacterized delta-60 repeat protein